MTLHASKGLEFDTVFIIRIKSGTLAEWDAVVLIRKEEEQEIILCEDHACKKSPGTFL